jgi:hypothetical protein
VERENLCFCIQYCIIQVQDAGGRISKNKYKASLRVSRYVNINDFIHNELYKAEIQLYAFDVVTFQFDAAEVSMAISVLPLTSQNDRYDVCNGFSKRVLQRDLMNLGLWAEAFLIDKPLHKKSACAKPG